MEGRKEERELKGKRVEGGNRVRERMEQVCKESRKIVGRAEGRITKCEEY